MVPFDLKESKLYALAQSEDLVAGFTPEFSARFSAESEIAENFPRDETDADSIRILINYTNLKQNSVLYKVNYKERMTSPADIDDFINKFVEVVINDPANPVSEDPVELLKLGLMTALSFSVTAALNVDTVETPTEASNLARWFIGAACATIFDDPLDVVMYVQEMTVPGSDETRTGIAAMWCAKSRDA